MPTTNSSHRTLLTTQPGRSDGPKIRELFRPVPDVLEWLHVERAEETTLTGEMPLASLIGNNFTPDQTRTIERELCKVMQSPLLIQSSRLSRFLSFTVEMALRGEGHSLKEYVIGIEAYGRPHGFDPSQDSIVRTEARRLRGKLKKYYQEEGKKDPIFIYFRPGSYEPAFHVNASSLDSPTLLNTDTSQPLEDSGIPILVVPFTHLCGDTLAEACAQGLTDELIHRLTKTEGVRVFANLAQRCGPSLDAYMTDKRPSRVTSDGSVRTEGNKIRVTSRFYDSEGLLLFSSCYDTKVSADELFDPLEQIASAIVSCIMSHRPGQQTPTSLLS